MMMRSVYCFGLGDNMKIGSWTARVGMGWAGLLGAVMLFLVVIRVVGVDLFGVAPEAWLMTFMMTSPFTLGLIALTVLATWGLEKCCRRADAV